MKNWDIIKKIFQYYIKVNGKKFLILTFITAALAWGVSYLEPLIFLNILDKLEMMVKWEDVATKAIVTWFAVWGAYIMFSMAVEFIHRYFMVAKWVLKTDVENARFFSEKIINMQYDKYLKTKSGSIYKKFDNGVEKITFFLFTILWETVRVIFAQMFVFIALFILDYRLALALLSVMPLFFYIWYSFAKKTSKVQDELNDKWEHAYWNMSNALSWFGLLKTLNLEKRFQKKIMDDIEDVYDRQIKISKRWSLLGIHTWWSVMFARFVVLLTWVFLIQAGEISFALLILFLNYASYIYFGLSGILMGLRTIQDQLRAAWKLFEGFENLELDKNWEIWEKKINGKGKIEIKDLRFSYNEGKEILKWINLEIKPWEKIALVWETGSWKSTISNLLLRFWDVEKWEILYDGVNLNEISKDSIRDHIWIVMQDNSLFNTTIRENLLYAKPDATEEELITALKKAKAGFVLNLEDWLETMIGERGLKLSGWEKQRVSIARVFLKNPEVLILDEATSALDNRTEKDIQEALNELMEDKTTIVIAHRLTTIKKMDKIVVLNFWEIIESGTYDELINSKGKLYELANPDKLMIA